MTKRPDIPVSLAHLDTRDGVGLDGVIAAPHGRRRAALIWVHGLGSVFYSGQPLIREASTRLNAVGIGYFKFHNRGHGVVARAGKRLAGAAFERFGQSVEDIRAMVTFARARGYRRVILAGHSTGANKVLHYAARARDRRVSGIVLLSPISDVAAQAKRGGPRRPRVPGPRARARGAARPLDSPTGARGVSSAHAPQALACWNSSVLPSGSLHSICTPPPGCAFSMYLMPRRSSIAFIAS